MDIKLKVTSTYFNSGVPNMGDEIKCSVIRRSDLYNHLRKLSGGSRYNNPRGELVVSFLEDDEVMVEIYNGYRE